jgi:hypothetical protein
MATTHLFVSQEDLESSDNKNKTTNPSVCYKSRKNLNENDMISGLHQLISYHENSRDELCLDTIKTINNYIAHRDELKEKYLDEYVYATNDKIVPLHKKTIDQRQDRPPNTSPGLFL